MGIFDFFKGKNKDKKNEKPAEQNDGKEETPSSENINPEPENEPPAPEVREAPQEIVPPNQETPATPEIPATPEFQLLLKYRDHFAVFRQMQLRGNYAPVSAYEKPDGSLHGFLFRSRDRYVDLTAGTAVQKMKEKFQSELANGEIASYWIGYHSPWNQDGNFAVAEEDHELKAMAFCFGWPEVPEGHIAFPYDLSGDTMNWHPFEEFSRPQNDALFGYQPQEGINFFQDEEWMDHDFVENEHGIEVAQAGGQMGDTLAGIFGFQFFYSEEGKNYLNATIALALHLSPRKDEPGFVYHSLDGDYVSLQTLTHDGSIQTFIPVVHTDRILPFKTKNIREWANVGGIEAVLEGGGRDTFLVRFYATDYTKNKHRYLTEQNLDIKMAGIAFAFQAGGLNESRPEGEPKFADDFCGYFPNQDYFYLGVVDFTGIVVDFKEVQANEHLREKAYMVTVKLINKEDDPDFFVVDVYVHKTTMNFTHLENGMTVKGAIQFVGHIAEEN